MEEVKRRARGERSFQRCGSRRSRATVNGSSSSYAPSNCGIPESSDLATRFFSRSQNWYRKWIPRKKMTVTIMKLSKSSADSDEDIVVQEHKVIDKDDVDDDLSDDKRQSSQKQNDEDLSGAVSTDTLMRLVSVEQLDLQLSKRPDKQHSKAAFGTMPEKIAAGDLSFLFWQNAN
uniref:Uncharacterized protein n=1 Tax=Syphacia muris TaxID=451379 RepID=A0A0N5AI54_9BILA